MLHVNGGCMHTFNESPYSIKASKSEYKLDCIEYLIRDDDVQLLSYW